MRRSMRFRADTQVTTKPSCPSTLAVLHAQRIRAQTHLAQPLEPVLIPKLRTQFADFPYLHSSKRLEAVNLGDLRRLSVRPGVRISLSLGFSRIVGSAPDAQKAGRLCPRPHPLSG